MRKVSQHELLKLVQSGAELSTEDDAPRVIEGFTDLVTQTKSLVSAHKASAEKQNEVLAVVMDRLSTALEQFRGGDVDLKPLEGLLAEIKAIKQVERPVYQFNVQRNHRGLLTGMTASPVKSD